MSIVRVLLNADGSGIIVTNPSKINEKGAWRKSASQMNRIAGTAGVLVSQLPLIKGTLTIEGEFVKEGQKWSETDRKTGEVRSGTFTKPHFREEDATLELDQPTQFMLLAAQSFGASFMRPAAAPVSAQKVIVDTDHAELDNEPADEDIDETNTSGEDAPIDVKADAFAESNIVA